MTRRLLAGSIDLERLRLAAPALGRSAIAAGFAWFLCHDLLGHRNGIWGPIGALLALNPPGRSSKRVIETASGAVVGLAVGNLLIAAIGTGPVQVAAVTFLAMATATVLGADVGVVTQAGIASALIATIEPPHGLYNTVAVNRLIDILVGGGVGVAASVLLRPNPLTSTSKAADRLFDEFGSVIDEVADALAARKADEAVNALERARHLDDQLHELRGALELADESVRLVPPYWRMRAALTRWRVADRPLEFAVRNVRVMARSAVRVIELEPQPPDGLSAAIRQLAAAVRAVEHELESDGERPRAEEAVLKSAGLATLVAEPQATMPVGAMVAQIPAAATDLLEALGVDHKAAVTRVREAADYLTRDGVRIR